jgi:tetratricopeptide (TPR) repeat protein
MGQFQDAIDAYGNSLSINPDSSQTHNNLGSALAEAGKLDAAIEQIHKAIELNPDNGAAHVNMGHILVVSGGDREQTKLELQKGIELAPKLADGHNLYGVILAREGRLDDAIAEMQIAVDLAPRSAECHFNLGRAFAANSRFTDAVPHFEAAASLTGGKEPAILQMLAGIYSDTGKYAKAVEVAQHALDLAEQRQDQELAAQLRANLARYRQQAQSTQP